MIKERKTNCGSEWHKWDLHLHTPFTALCDGYKLNDMDDTNPNTANEKWKKFCKEINRSGLSAIGITDYFSIKNYKILCENRKLLGLNDDILLLPNIEMRVNDLTTNAKKGQGKVNIHVIFSNLLPVEKIEKFLRELRVKTPEGTMNFLDDFNALKDNGKFHYYPDSEIIINALKNAGIDKKYYLLMNAAGNDGICCDFQKAGSFKDAKFIVDHIDIIQVQRSHQDEEAPHLYFQSDFLYYVDKNLHQKIRPYPCIIASDSRTFEEIGTFYTWIKSDLSFEGLKQIIFEPKDRISYADPIETKSYISELRYKNKYNTETIVKFNEGLNTIIGERSTGKSTLINTICKNTNNFIKSTIDNFKNNDENNYDLSKTIDNKTTIELIWNDKKVHTDTTKEKRSIIYLPQDFMINIADHTNNGSPFNSLVRTIILNTSNSKAFKKICEKEQEIRNIEEQLSLKYKDFNEILKLKKLKKSALMSIDSNQLKSQIQIIEQQIENLNYDKEDFNEQIQKFNDFNKQIKEHKNNNYILNIDLEKILCKKYEFKEFKEKFHHIYHELQLDNSKSEYATFLNELDIEINNLYKQYNILINKFNTKKTKENIYIQNIINSTEYKNCLENIDSNNKLGKLITKKQALLSQLMEAEQQENELKNLNNQAKVKYDNLINSFLEYLSKVNDTEILYSARDKNDIEISYKISYKKLTNVITYISKKSYANFEKFDDSIINKNESALDILKNEIIENENLTLNRNKSISDLLHSLFNESLIDIQYDIKYQGDSFRHMSQGKKSFVILKLLLEFSDSTLPIIIDQPEDNLDNKSIYKDLIRYLKELRKKRQIIIVTHNANLVVSADSDNIIIAHMDNSGSSTRKFNYINGAIENEFKEENNDNFLMQKTIKQHIFEILEGGEEAFHKREIRYLSK